MHVLSCVVAYSCRISSLQHCMQLFLLSCLEVAIHRSTYVLPRADEERDPGTPCLFMSCGRCGLLAVIAALQIRIFSFFLPQQPTFMPPMTIEVSVFNECHSVAVIWSTTLQPRNLDLDLNDNRQTSHREYHTDVASRYQPHYHYATMPQSQFVVFLFQKRFSSSFFRRCLSSSSHD